MKRCICRSVTDLPAPFGAMWVCAGPDALCAAGFGVTITPRTARALTCCGYAFQEGTSPLLEEAIAQVRAYLAGERRDFGMPLELCGTPFQMSVWETLRRIPYGETRSYAEIAAAIGRPRAARAVGQAVGRNPLTLFVPCHRVIGRGGKLTGFGGGLERKAALLALESTAHK